MYLMIAEQVKDYVESMISTSIAWLAKVTNRNINLLTFQLTPVKRLKISGNLHRHWRQNHISHNTWHSVVVKPINRLNYMNLHRVLFVRNPFQLHTLETHTFFSMLKTFEYQFSVHDVGTSHKNVKTASIFTNIDVVLLLYKWNLQFNKEKSK